MEDEMAKECILQIKGKGVEAAQTISPQNFMHDQNYVIDSFITKFFS